MIIDLPAFMQAEQAYWTELEQILKRLEREPEGRLHFAELQRFHYLYDRASADLARLVTFSSEPELRNYLEALVARAYGEIHETRRGGRGVVAWRWISISIPQTFRRHVKAFWLTAAVTVLGALFGGGVVAFDDEAKEAILPEMFSSHLGSPEERVAREEGRAKTGKSDEQQSASASRMAAFSAFLMQNNIGVSIKSLALGMTYGLGTIVLLFYNGVILGAVGVDYILAGETWFLLGWLLPHGVIEIPAILIGAQGGLVLAHALIGWGRRDRLAARLRAIGPDLATLIGTAALLMVWAGIIEAFFSQFHEPYLPYKLKISFGIVEFLVLLFYLFFSARNRSTSSSENAS